MTQNPQKCQSDDEGAEGVTNAAIFEFIATIIKGRLDSNSSPKKRSLLVTFFFFVSLGFSVRFPSSLSFSRSRMFLYFYCVCQKDWKRPGRRRGQKEQQQPQTWPHSWRHTNKQGDEIIIESWERSFPFSFLSSSFSFLHLLKKEGNMSRKAWFQRPLMERVTKRAILFFLSYFYLFIWKIEAYSAY